MGEVFLADDPHIDRKLAIKTVRLGDESPAEQEERKVRLMREAKAAGRVVHPNVVTLFDAGEAADGVFYLAFEYVAGMDLSQRIRQPPLLTMREVIRIVRQAAEGLDAAHKQGIVHRDIKPSNILLDQHGQVKVSDFGIAKMLGQATELTQTGSVVGSPHYLSPEQIRGEELDGRSDLFSLGVVLYELLTRTRPFEGDTITTLVYQILARDPMPIGGYHPGLPPRLGSIVARLLAKERDQRFATARELADELAACERELPKEQLDGLAAPLASDLDGTHRLLSSTDIPMPAVSTSSMTMHAGSGAPPPPPGNAPGAVRDATEATRLQPPPRPPVGGPAAQTAPPPMPPPPAMPGAPAAAPAYAARPAAPQPVPAKRGFPCAILAVVGIIGLLAVAGGIGGWFWWRHHQEQTALASATSDDTASGTEPSPSSSAATEPAAPATTMTSTAAVETPRSQPAVPTMPSAQPAPSLATPLSAAPPAAAPGPAPPIRITPAQPRNEAAHAAAPPAAPTKPPVNPPASQGREQHHPAAPPAAVEPAREEPAGRDQQAETEQAAPETDYDRELATTTRLKFDVKPDEAVISFKQEGDRRFTVIGRAADYDASKRKLPAFDLPGPGVYYVRINANGSVITYRITASQGAQPTTISQVLIPKR